MAEDAATGQGSASLDRETEVVVRPARRPEIPAIAAVAAAAYAPHRHRRPAPVWAAHVAETCDIGRRWDESVTLVAEVGGAIVGTVAFYGQAMGLPSGWAGLRALAVDPSAQGRGVGRALTLDCVARARAAGREALAVHTSAELASAMALYRALGFRRCPEHDADATALLGFAGEAPSPLVALKLDLRDG